MSAPSPRRRAVGLALGGLLVAWALALGGWLWARHTAPTADRLAAWLRGTELAALDGDARRRALERLARELNRLPPDERRLARVERAWGRWFAEMNDAEKSAFLEATLPAGFQQMIAAFEELPADRRQKAVDDALRRLREARESAEAGGSGPETDEAAGSPPEELSPELREQFTKLGLKTFYSESTAQTKAEVAPLLEEMQRLMETGGFVRRGRRPPPAP
ncbi:MAG: hypothetical protein ACKVYV_06125 [Limisphaerales bacterium]